MIKTTHIKLDKAAEMLGTDADTLLIAASEGRIRLYGLMNQFLPAVKTKYIGGDKNDPQCYEDLITAQMWDYVPLISQSCAELLCKDETLEIFWVSEPDEDGDEWQIAGVPSADGDMDPTPEIRIGRKCIFAKREHIEEIITKGRSPDAGTVKDHEPKQNASAETKRRNTYLSLIAALLNQIGVDRSERGLPKRIADWTQLIGASVTDDTISDILKQIPLAIEMRNK